MPPQKSLSIPLNSSEKDYCNKKHFPCLKKNQFPSSYFHFFFFQDEFQSFVYSGFGISKSTRQKRFAIDTSSGIYIWTVFFFS